MSRIIVVVFAVLVLYSCKSIERGPAGHDTKITVYYINDTLGFITYDAFCNRDIAPHDTLTFTEKT